MRWLWLPLLLPSVLAAPGARAEVVERVVAKVNGQIITLSEFQGRQLEAAQAARVDASTIAAFLRQHNSRILQEAIDEILLLQKAEDADLEPPALYVDEVITQIRKEHDLASQQELEAALAREGLSLGELRRNVERRIQREMIIRRDIEPKMTLTDEDLRAEYERLRDGEFTTPAKVTLQEIEVASEEEAEALAARARGGEDFAALARAHSEAATRAHGGEVGEVAVSDMNRELRHVVLELPTGGVSEPMPSPGGYRVVKVVARAEAATQPFEDVREKLRERVMMTRFETEYDAYLEELRKNAQIELRVREVPLQLSGPIPEGSLLEGLEDGVGGASSAPSASAAPEPAPPEPAVPAGIGEDEITMTPQSAPERVAPAAAPTPAPPSGAQEDPAPGP